LHSHKLENLPSPLFAKEGYYPSLWKREGRRDFKINKIYLKISRRLCGEESSF
jgi:hypothetical protein